MFDDDSLESNITLLAVVWREFEYVMTSGAAATKHVERYFENEKDDLQVNLTRADRLDIES